MVAEASNSDISSLHEFILEAWKEAGPSAWGWTGATEERVQELASVEYLKQLVSNPKLKVLLAKDRERIVGFAVNRRVDETTVELAGVIVLGRLTGMGIGTALMGAAMKAATAGGFKEITVKTESFNQRAIGFYEANGFKRIGLSSEELDGNRVDLTVLGRPVAKTERDVTDSGT